MKRKLYHINCDCASYDWTRYPSRSAFMRCKYCGKKLGDMEISIVGEKNSLYDLLSRKENPNEH